MWGFYVGAGEGTSQEEVRQADCIMDKESKGNPDAHNPSSATGLFQIHWLSWRVFFAKQDMTDPYDSFQNGVMAGQIYDRSGRSWRQWTTHALCE